MRVFFYKDNHGEDMKLLKNRQKNNKIDGLRTGFAAVALSFILAIDSSVAYEKMIWSEGSDYVAIETVDQNVTNAHPAQLDQNQIYQLLKSIRTQEAKSRLFDLKIFDSEDDYSTGLFTKPELLVLSRHVSRALMSATAKQDVIFSVTGTHSKSLGKASLTSTGRVFVADGKLNLIIGEYRVDLAQKYRKRGGYSDVSEKIDQLKLNQFRLETGERNESRKPDFQFLLEPYQDLHATNGSPRNDWLEVKIDEALNFANNEVKDESVSETQVKSLTERVETLERQSDPAAQSTDSSLQERNSVEQRLERLKSLYEKGLIDESSYKQKMQSILNDI